MLIADGDDMLQGARWYSMEMAGVVTHCGAGIISVRYSPKHCTLP